MRKDTLSTHYSENLNYLKAEQCKGSSSDQNGVIHIKLSETFRLGAKNI